VAATSSTNAWAAGYYCTSGSFLPCRTVVEHWGGKAWRVQRSLNPHPRGGDDELDGVAATSSHNAWAVGSYDANNKNTPKINTLIEHWNGSAWKVQASPNPTHQNTLHGVAATSRNNAWAVGGSLIEHWNGKTWTVQKSALPGGSLYGVAATSSKNAWAVGDYYYYGGARTLVEHWNGKAWKVQPSPNPGGFYNFLNGVAATSSTSAWAVGYDCNKRGPCQTLVEHWNGKLWKVQSSPTPGCGTDVSLSGVAAPSSTSVWAVGYCTTRGVTKTLIEHWGGKAWKVQLSSSLRGGRLSGVAATSSNNAWAVGDYRTTPGHAATLIQRWSGQR
jgi:hypothetical protein